MKGLGNHSLLDGARFVGRATLENYGLYCVSPSFPGAVQRHGAAVEGEIYEVDSSMLGRLVNLEGKDTLYSRVRERCTMKDETAVRAYVYRWLGKVREQDYVPVDFAPWHPDVLQDVSAGIGKRYFYFFAYGRYCNVREVRKLFRDAGLNGNEDVVGIGICDNHRLAFTRKRLNGCGALDIVPSAGDHALGLIYRMPPAVLPLLDRKEGCPSCYERITIRVACGDQSMAVQAYTVVDKHKDEVAPDNEYYETVLEGAMDRFPVSYINKYLIEHCNSKFSFDNKTIQAHALYHDDRSKPPAAHSDPHLVDMISRMARHLGNDNRVVEAIAPTPEMFRILVKLADMQFRDVLDYGYRIPRELTNVLAAEFEMLTGLKMGRLG